MRLCTRELNVNLTVVPDTTRPIRLRTGAFTCAMSQAEAIELANQLADAVEELRTKQREETHQ